MPHLLINDNETLYNLGLNLCIHVHKSKTIYNILHKYIIKLTLFFN